MNQFQTKDELGRNLFLEAYPTNFSCVQKMPDMCQHDLEATGTTANGGTRYSIEIKVRNNSSTDYNSTTLIQEDKLEHFKSILASEPSRVLIYAVFFSDNVVQLYNIGARIREAQEPGKSWMLNTYQQKFQSNDTSSSYQKLKDVLDLSFNSNLYNDTKKIYFQ